MGACLEGCFGGKRPREELARLVVLASPSFKSRGSSWSSPSREIGSRVQDDLLTEQRGGRRTEHTLNLWQVRGGSSRRLEDFYENPELLGEGAFGAVSKWKMRSTPCSRASFSLDSSSGGTGSTFFAVKQIRWQSIWRSPRKRRLEQEEAIRGELATLVTLDHPNIAMIREWFEDSSEGIFFVMELCEGGSMQVMLDDVCREPLAEKRAAVTPRFQRYFHDMLYAVSYMHSQGVVHRDLKPDNVMLRTADPDSGIKLIDFGLAALIEEPASPTSPPASPRPGDDYRWQQGTMMFMAPEMFLTTSGMLNETSDMWSLGVILTWIAAAMQHGKLQHPMISLEDGSKFDVEFYTLYCAFKAETPIYKDYFDSLPSSCLSLAADLLAYDPQERASAPACLENEWVKCGDASSIDLLKVGGAVENIKNFQWLSPFEQSMLTLMALNISDDQATGLREAFEALDTDKQGKISRQQLADGLDKCGIKMSARDLDGIFDQSNDDTLDYLDFLSASLGKNLVANEEAASKVFHSLDVTGTGALRPEDLAPIVGLEAAEEAVDNYKRRRSASALSVDDFFEALHSLSERRLSLSSISRESVIELSVLASGSQCELADHDDETSDDSDDKVEDAGICPARFAVRAPGGCNVSAGISAPRIAVKAA